MPLLEDGSERGLKGHFREDFSHRTRIGMAPRAGHIDRDAPYKRIATEEAWTFPALVKAQVEYFESGDAPDDDSLRMGAMFANMPSLQEMLQDLGDLARGKGLAIGRVARVERRRRRVPRQRSRGGFHFFSCPASSLPNFGCAKCIGTSGR